MPTKHLPARPHLKHLKQQAKDLRTEHAAGRPDVCQRIREFHPRFKAASDEDICERTFSLADAYLTIAREYGFASWARLKTQVETGDSSELDRPHHERIGDPDFRRAVDLLDDGNADDLRTLLTDVPNLVRRQVTFEGGNYFRQPTLLEFIAENPIRHDSLPPNIVEVAQVILDAGAKDNPNGVNTTLSLVCSGQVSRECGVQVPLIDLLCDYGADPNGAMLSALGHGEFEAVNALIRRGAAVDLVTAAATGRLEDARRQLAHADESHRHRALALSTLHGHLDVTRLLLDAGEDPSRYNPVGCHAHSTPLHQAALAGHRDVVELLVERGARLDLPDIHFQGTPRDWAEHAGQREIARYLSSQSNKA